MTTQEKNIEIALMLGWVLRKDEIWGSNWVNSNNEMVGVSFKPDLLFHSDANWQFEALDWVAKWIVSKEVNGEIAIEYFEGEIHVTIDSFKNLKVVKKTAKEAIFEALYQFSQYLKTKK